MKRFYLSILLIGALLVGASNAQAVVVVAGPAPYYYHYYHPWHRYWARPYRMGVPVLVAPRAAYVEPAPYYPSYYAPAPVAVVQAPAVTPPIAIGLGFRIR